MIYCYRLHRDGENLSRTEIFGREKTLTDDERHYDLIGFRAPLVPRPCEGA